MGVYWDNSSKGSRKGGCYEKARFHNKWRAEITVNNVRIRLGRFTSKLDAEREVELAKIKYGKYKQKNENR